MSYAPFPTRVQRGLLPGLSRATDLISVSGLLRAVVHAARGTCGLAAAGVTTSC